MTASILAIYGPTNTGKIERHIKPLADIADTTLVCIESGGAHEGLTYRTVPSFGFRPIGLVLMFVVGLAEAHRNDYDGLVSFSLFPHGCIALVIGRLAGLPVHLGILGIDLDVHVQAFYGWVVRILLLEFDAVSVPGTTHRNQLHAIGVPAERCTILANAIDVARFEPAVDHDRSIDFLWVGRFGPEKNPLLFVDAMAVLDTTLDDFQAVMLGDGPLREDVERAIREQDLVDSIHWPGWVDDPLPYFRRSKIFVLTSRRDALPLTLVEAMSIGVAPVVPRVGNITDVVEDGRTGVVLDVPDAETLASSLAHLLHDDAYRARVARSATAVRDRYSIEAARNDWIEILQTMAVRESAPAAVASQA